MHTMILTSDRKGAMKVFGFAGYSGSGKTTLIEQLIPRLVKRGLRVSVIKHAHHDFDIRSERRDEGIRFCRVFWQREDHAHRATDPTACEARPARIRHQACTP